MHGIPLQHGIVYGPISSRRLGLSLGLNILPTSYKLCSFNCIYCQYGWTQIHTLDASIRLDDLPTPVEVRNALEEALQKHQDLSYITFSGNGEPTLHPHFNEMVDIARELKERYIPDARLAVLSNSSTMCGEKAVRGLDGLDVRMMKLDVGDPETFIKINRPCKGLDFKAMVDALKSFKNITLQAMFVSGKFQNIGNQEVRDWIDRVSEILPMEVQIYSLHRPPAEERLREVGVEKLNEIAEEVRRVIKIPVNVIKAHSPYRYHRKNCDNSNGRRNHK